MTLLSVQDLRVSFPVRRAGAWPWEKSQTLRAVDGVSFDLAAGETLGVVGESGSGKSTLARAIVNTLPASGGKVVWLGHDVLALGPGALRHHRRDVQMVFQDPLAALNPRMTVGQIIAEPLRTHYPNIPGVDVKAQVREMMERVGLLPNLVNRYPHEFSGGQCQRIGIARALILRPKLVVCDEPVSALDVSIKAQVVNLLQALQRDLGISLIFIGHDLSVVRHISHRIMVMYLGNMMELAPARELIARPRHPYTQLLIASVPIPDPAKERLRVRPEISSVLPSPLNPPSGCVFRTRCPKAQPVCGGVKPVVLQPVAGHLVACPFHD